MSSARGSGGSGETRISKRVEKELHQSKVVIRRLPPDFTEEKLLEKISPLPPHNYFYFAPGESSLGAHGCCRAYINFSNESDIIPFRDQFDGYVFRTEKGQSYHAIIEYAPLQGIPKKSKRKLDSRCGTIEQDADYKTFLQSLETKTEPLPSLELGSYMEEKAASRVRDIQKTPLIEYLEDKKAARKASRNKVYVVESKKKRKGSSEPPSKSKFSKAGGKGAESSKGSKFPKDDSGSQKGRSEDQPPRDKKERRGQDMKEQRSGSAVEIGASNHVPDSSSKKQRGSWPRDSWESRGEGGRGRGMRNFERDDRRKGSGGEKRGSYEGETGEERDRGWSRNKERPDRALYTPRGRDREQGGGRREPRERDHWSKRGESGRGNEDQGRSKGRYYGDKQDRGEGWDRERSDEKEWGRKPWGDRNRDRYGGGAKSKDYQYGANYDRPKSSGLKDK